MSSVAEAAAAIDEALAVLGRGGVVAAATESFFGLLADATAPVALDRLFSLKPRGRDQGVPLLLPDADAVASVALALPELARRLAAELWPGPLSLVLPARPELDPRLTLDGTVAVRVPGASAAAELVRRFGRPLTATSANLPGLPPSTRAQDVAAAFSTEVAAGRLAVLAGRCPGGRPSTLVVVRGDRIEVVREGAISRHELERVLGGG